MQREDAGTAAITVDAPGFHGTLEELVARANRGDVNVTELTVSSVIAEARAALEAPERRGDLRATADVLALLARLVALKAAAVLPDQTAAAIEPEEDPSTDAGRRLAEYRLFKAAAEALLAEAVTEGTRSFLGLVATDVIPVERLRIAPGAACRGLPGGPRAPGRRGTTSRRGHLLGGGQGAAPSRAPRASAGSTSRRSSPACEPGSRPSRASSRCSSCSSAVRRPWSSTTRSDRSR